MDTIPVAAAIDTSKAIEVGTDSLSAALTTPVHGFGHASASYSYSLVSLLGPATILGLLAVFAAVVLFYLAVGWRIFAKAGRPGWASLIPFYNSMVLLRICGRPLWWFLLLFLPLVNLAVAVVLVFDLARKFGRSFLFGLGLLAMGFLFAPILAFGDSRYDAEA